MKKKLFIFHYHFLRGGVASVIRDMVFYLKDSFDITLVGDLSVGIDGVEKISEYVNFYDLPEIGYLYDNSTDYKLFEERKEKITRKISDFLSPDALFWIHNYHLGKNPAFTDAIIEFITKNEIRTILHIHDFPECARWNNYTFLRKYVKQSFYPQKDWIFYAVINRSDYKRLSDAGISENHLFYFPNLFKNKKANEENIISKKELLDKCDGNIIKGAPIVTYPVRTIRRKNILEAFLLSKTVENINLFVTLPANSEKERRYETLVKKASKTSSFKGCWAFSEKYPELFVSLMENTDLFISTSVLEGFGLIFLESASYKKALFAKKISVVDDFKNFENVMLYDSLKVPQDFLDREKIKIAYFEKISRLPLENEFKERLFLQIEELLDKEVFDFSFLPPEDMYRIFLEEYDGIKDINKKVIEDFNALLFSSATDFELSDFSENNYIKNLDKLIKKVYNYTNTDNRDEIDKKVLDSFVVLDNMRLLFDY